MLDIWSKVRALEGQTLQTLARGKKFKVVGVLADRVQFVPEDGTGTVRWCTRKGIEHIADLGLGTDELTASRIQQEWPSDRNGSYVAAIVHQVTHGIDA